MNENIVITGFRDKDLQEKIELMGGNIQSGVSSKTTLIIAKNPNGNSSKIKKGKELKINIVDIEKFMKTYYE